MSLLDAAAVRRRAARHRDPGAGNTACSSARPAQTELPAQPAACEACPGGSRGSPLRAVSRTTRRHRRPPSQAKSRVSRHAEYLLHLSVDRTPFFDRAAWQTLAPRLGGPNTNFESAEKITDVWSLPTSTGKASPTASGGGRAATIAPLTGTPLRLTSASATRRSSSFAGGHERFVTVAIADSVTSRPRWRTACSSSCTRFGRQRSRPARFSRQR
jgi:hypothetical protein